MDNSSNIQYGGFWRRGFAFLIDLMFVKFFALILMGLGVLASCQALQDLKLNSPSEDLVLFLTGLFILVDLLFFFSYFFYFNLIGQTPGKKILHLKINSFLNSPAFFQALIRTSAFFMSFFTLGLGFLMMFFNKKKQTLHDFMAGTYVTKI